MSTESKSSTGKKVLIVDDELDVRIYVRTLFETSGYTPIVTRNGMEIQQMAYIAELINVALRNVEIISDTEYTMEQVLARKIAKQVEHLCEQFPLR